MSYENNLTLTRLCKDGDKEALSQLVENNLGLVKSIAVRFLGRGQELDDLIQIGTIGMIKAARRFDEEHNTAFSTYAVHMIVGEIKRFLRDDGLIKVNRETKKNYGVLRFAMEKYEKEQGCEPTLEVLCELTGISKEDAVLALGASNPYVSLQEKLSSDEDSDTFEALIGTDKTEEITDRIALSQAINTLKKEEKELIEMRYFKGLTQIQCAKILSVSQVKVSRMEKKIIEKLKDFLACESA